MFNKGRTLLFWREIDIDIIGIVLCYRL